MPRTLRRRAKRRQTTTIVDLSIGDQLWLLTGVNVPTGGDIFHELADMKKFYIANESLFTTPYSGKPRDLGYSPGRRPWCWWEWSSSEKRGHSYSEESEQLFAMGELTNDEIESIRQEVVTIHGLIYRLPFRRHWLWWRKCAPEQRDNDMLEVSQLINLALLTDDEQTIVDNPSSIGTRRFYHLEPAELELLGLAHKHGEQDDDVPRVQRTGYSGARRLPADSRTDRTDDG